MFLKFFVCLFVLERGEGRERNIDVKEKRLSVTSCTHPIWGPDLQHRYITSNLLLCGTMPNQLSHAGQRSNIFLSP